MRAEAFDCYPTFLPTTWHRRPQRTMKTNSCRLLSRVNVSIAVDHPPRNHTNVESIASST